MHVVRVMAPQLPYSRADAISAEMQLPRIMSRSSCPPIPRCCGNEANRAHGSGHKLEAAGFVLVENTSGSGCVMQYPEILLHHPWVGPILQITS